MIGSEGPQGTVADDFHGFSLSQNEINTSWASMAILNALHPRPKRPTPSWHVLLIQPTEV
jgi:hypothetical protein